MRNLFIILTLFLVFVPAGFAADYRYVSAEQLQEWLEAKKPVQLVDIQVAEDFARHHIKGSVQTNAYPVKSAEEKKQLDVAVKQSREEDYEAIVVVCPRGKGGAKRTYEYLAENGVPVEKLYILTGGMENWPYAQWVAK